MSDKKSLIKKLKYSSSFAWFWNVLSYPVGWILFFWTSLTDLFSKVYVTGPMQNYEGPAVYVHWHKHNFYLVHHDGLFRRWLLVSSAPYMAPIAKWCELCGHRLVRGASGENGKAALQALLQKVQEGGSVVLAVDGPGGPIFEVKRGCVDLSKMSGVPIIPVGYRCKKAKPNPWRWDQALVPRLFDEIAVEYGEPIYPESRQDQEILIEIKTKLLAIDRAFGT